MSYQETEIGRVIQCSGDGSFKWIIDHFLSSSHYNYKCRLRSPMFTYLDFECRLFIDFGPPESGEVAVSLRHNFRPLSNDPILLVILRMKTDVGGRLENRCGRATKIERDHYYKCFRVLFWMTFSEMSARRREIVERDGSLIIFCDLKPIDSKTSTRAVPLPVPEKKNQGDRENSKNVEKDEESESDDDEDETLSERKSVKKLRKALKNLLVNAEDFDVTLKVQDKEFRAHRGILRARSPVFQSMFTHDTIEKEKGEVVIDDCDPDAFADFLDHVYTGNTTHVSPKNVFSLYTISDKYRMLELRETCGDFLGENLSVELFCETVSLALLHGEKVLIELATEFFCQNADEITKSAKWQTFLEKNATIGNELFRKALKRGKMM